MKPAAERVPAASSARHGAGLNRRSLLHGRFRVNVKPAVVRPPWSSEASIAQSCTACGACSETCPEEIIAVGEDGTPVVDFAAGECSFCGACAAACPEPVFGDPGTPPWQLSLLVTDSCLAASGVYCRSCGDACPESAIAFHPAIGGRAEIWFSPADCSGCGACVSACPVGAAVLTPATEGAHG